MMAGAGGVAGIQKRPKLGTVGVGALLPGSTEDDRPIYEPQLSSSYAG